MKVLKKNFALKQLTNIVKYILFLIFLLLITIISFSGLSSASEYILRGDEITFMEEKNTVVFNGNASFKSEDFTVTADKFVVNTAETMLWGENNIVITSEQSTVYGSSLEFNYETEMGTLYGAEGNIGELNFSGSSLNLISTSPVEGVLDDAEFTPCIREEPHYHFKAKEIRINPDNTLGIYDIVPYIGPIPVFYLPYYSVTYDPENKDQPITSTFPLPTIGYKQGVGVTVEFNYPYQLSKNNSGKFYYWKAGDEEKDIDFTHNYNITDNLKYRINYNYLYKYDTEDDVVDEEEEEVSTSLAYSRDRFDIETGLFRNLLKNDNKNLYFIDSGYRFQSGINAHLRQEYDREEMTAESYSLSSNRWWVNWNLKYVDGEDYNYYPYLSLGFPRYFGFSPYYSFGRVENGGVELDKYRTGYNFNYSLALPLGFSYQLSHDYRIDHYKSGYDQNYHYRRLNTGFRFSRDLSEQFALSTAIFYEENTVTGSSPLPDDREDEEELLKPSFSIDLKGELPQSAWALDSDGIYNLRTEEWDEITLRVRKKEDCFTAFVGYEFIDKAVVWGLEL